MMLQAHFRKRVSALHQSWLRELWFVGPLKDYLTVNNLVNIHTLSRHGNSNT